MSTQERQIEALGIRLEKVLEENARLKQQLEGSRFGVESWKKAEVDEKIDREDVGEYELVIHSYNLIGVLE